VNPANNFLPVEFQQIEVDGEYLVSFFSELDFGNSCLKSANALSFSLIKSQTLTPFSVAADTHYNLGLKQI
jgi:hypothetical protein